MNLGHNVHILLKTAKQELLEFLTVENAVLSEKINERPKFRGVCEPLLKHSIGKIVAGPQLEITHYSHPLSGPAGPGSIIQDGSRDEKGAAGTRKMRKRGPGARAGGETWALAAAVGISPQYLSYILNGTRSGKRYIEAIARVLELDQKQVGKTTAA